MAGSTGSKRSRAAASSAEGETISLKKLVQDGRFQHQLDVPVYMLLTIFVAHALSGSATLQSINLPHSLQNIIPSWVHSLPQLSPYDADVPNASHNSKILNSLGGPFKSDAAGFGHPLTALHIITRACLGLSYPVQSTAESVAGKISGMLHNGSAANAKPWDWFLHMANTNYTKGPLDLAFTLMWAVAWTAIRAAVITHVLIPLGTRWVVPEKTPKGREDNKKERRKAARATEKSIMRFAEQGWCVCYYVPSLALGLWVASRQPYWPLKTEHFWIGYPHNPIDGLTKFYYLVQGGFWMHQLLVLNLEAKRKDYGQMLAHHFITIALLVSSYMTNFHRIGNAILCLMDPSDILLSAAKCLRYVGQQTICDVTFALFVLSWIITRHILFGIVIWSVATQGPEYDWSPEKGWYFTPAFQTVMVGLLLALQLILLSWFAMIAKVAWKVVTGSGAHDSRSDDESDSESEPPRSDGNPKAASSSISSNSKGAKKRR